MNKKKINVLIFMVINIAIFLVAMLIFQLRSTKTADGINSLESKYNISFSNTDVKLCNTTMAQDIDERLQFHVDSYHSFMANQYNGEIVNFVESNDYSSAQYKCKPYPKSTDSLQKRLTFKIQFTYDNIGYDAVLTSYYE